MISIGAYPSAFKPYSRPTTIHSPERMIPDENNGKLKTKRKRTTFTTQQAQILEKEYELDQYMPRSRRIAVADALLLTENQIKTWFQNRRAKDKKAKNMSSFSEYPPSSEGNRSLSPCSNASNSTVSPSTVFPSTLSPSSIFPTMSPSTVFSLPVSSSQFLPSSNALAQITQELQQMLPQLMSVLPEA